MDFTLPEELQMLQRTVREYVESRLQPLSRQIEEEDRIPDEVVREMANMGFFGVPFPECYGGMGAGSLGYSVFLEELGRTNASISNLVGASCSLCATAIYLDGSEDQKQRYLTPLARGEKIGAFCLSEPNAGSDAASIRTSAKQVDGGWLLNGEKIFITNAPIADVFVVFASTDRSLGPRGGISAFIVEKGTPGLQVGKPDEKMGLRGSHTAPVIFEDCRVPAENLLGKLGHGFATAMKVLDRGRIYLAAGAVGGAQKLLEMSLEYARQRYQFGQPLANFQAIQWMLADSATELHAARLMVYQAAWKVDRGERVSREAGMAKLFASEMAGRVADRAVQIHGGMGYMKELPIERAYRDARILRIYEGTSEVQRMVIAEDLIRNG